MDHVYSVQECNARCNNLSWCTNFFIGTPAAQNADGVCVVVGAGCEKSDQKDMFKYYEKMTIHKKDSCGLDEALTKNKCIEDEDCNGKRTCSAFGWCHGKSGCA